MKRIESSLACSCCPVSRRQFLAAGCAACAGASGLLTMPGSARADSTGKTRVRIVYSCFGVKQTRPTWPHIGFDFAPVIAQIEARLKEACPGVEFVTAMADGPEQAEKILAEDKAADIDGYVVYQMNNWAEVVKTIAASGKPTLFVDYTYGGTGGFLVQTAALLRRKQSNFSFVSSSDLDDLAAAVKCFESVEQGEASVDRFAAAANRVRKERTPAPGDMTCKPDALRPLDTKDCLAAMKQGKILAIGKKREPLWDAITKEMGIEVVEVSFADLAAAVKAADRDEAKRIADRWQKGAASIENVSGETLDKSAAMYMAQKALLKQHGANAITIHCLAGFYGNHITAYPCLGFHELNNEGMIGACECDLMSSATMIAMSAMTRRRPGFISDPVLDTSKHQIIYSHCVASTKVFGPEGETNPFHILTHSEDRRGAAVRSVVPVGYMTTTVKFDPLRKKLLFHQGKALANVAEDRGCRTKLAVEPVGDIEKLFGQWDHWSWHRVTYYGDVKEPVFALADALGWKVIEEA